MYGYIYQVTVINPLSKFNNCYYIGKSKYNKCDKKYHNSSLYLPCLQGQLSSETLEIMVPQLPEIKEGRVWFLYVHQVAFLCYYKKL